MAVDAKKVQSFLKSLPGQRGGDVPAEAYDRIFPAANAITQQVWGEYPLPNHIAALYQAGAHAPEQIAEHYSQMDHPHVPDVTVGQYPLWASAFSEYQKHQ